MEIETGFERSPDIKGIKTIVIGIAMWLGHLNVALISKGLRPNTFVNISI